MQRSLPLNLESINDFHDAAIFVKLKSALSLQFTWHVNVSDRLRYFWEHLNKVLTRHRDFSGIWAVWGWRRTTRENILHAQACICSSYFTDVHCLLMSKLCRPFFFVFVAAQFGFREQIKQINEPVMRHKKLHDRYWTLLDDLTVRTGLNFAFHLCFIYRLIIFQATVSTHFIVILMYSI